MFVAVGVLCVALVVLAVWDLRAQILPDVITIPLLVAGLGVNFAWALFATPAAAVIGAIAGYGFLRSAGILHKRIRRTEQLSIGLGDCKLLAAIGAWLGWSAIPWIITGAALGALAGHLARWVKSPATYDVSAPEPFGQWLSVATFLFLISRFN